MRPPWVSPQHCEFRHLVHLHLCVTCRAHLDPWSCLKKLWTTSKSPLFTCFGEVSQKSHVSFVNAGSRGFLHRLLLKLLKDYGWQMNIPAINEHCKCLLWDLQFLGRWWWLGRMTGNQLGITREKAEDLMVRAFQSYCTKLSIFMCNLNSIKGMLTVQSSHLVSHSDHENNSFRLI